MSIDLNTRLAKFEDLIPSKIPFVEGKLKGHRDRSNYSVIGPGVSEDANPNAAVWLIKGYTPGDAAVGVLASAQMGATPYPSIPHMGLLHGALSTEMVEFLQGNESAEKALADVEAAYRAKATEQGFL